MVPLPSLCESVGQVFPKQTIGYDCIYCDRHCGAFMVSYFWCRAAKQQQTETNTEKSAPPEQHKTPSKLTPPTHHVSDKGRAGKQVPWCNTPSLPFLLLLLALPFFLISSPSFPLISHRKYGHRWYRSWHRRHRPPKSQNRPTEEGIRNNLLLPILFSYCFWFLFAFFCSCSVGITFNDDNNNNVDVDLLFFWNGRAPPPFRTRTYMLK